MAARSGDAIEYADFSAPIDLFVAGGGKELEKLEIVEVSGSATVTVATATGSANRTLTVEKGTELPVQIRAIVSVSGVTRVRAYFSAF